jgi:large subunit ribosomal protein L24
MEMKIKKGDMVKVIAGKDKGKTGKVLRTYPKDNKVVVEGVNVQTKHAKATRNTPAEIKHIEGPIDASNVMYYDTKAKQASRVGYKVKEDGTKSRVFVKTGKTID